MKSVPSVFTTGDGEIAMFNVVPILKLGGAGDVIANAAGIVVTDCAASVFPETR